MTDTLLSEAEKAAETNIDNLLRMTQGRDAFDTLVDALKKAGLKTSENKSSEFLQWEHGAYRLQVLSAGVFRWEQSGEECSCPILRVRVLDGSTREAKALVGKEYMISPHWGMARAIIDAMGMADDKYPALRLAQICKEMPEMVSESITMMVAQVKCDAGGVPIRKVGKSGRPFLADTHTVVG